MPERSEGVRMSVLRKIVLFPIKLVLRVIGLLVDLFIKAECFVAGIGGLFLVGCLIYSIVNQIWINVGLLSGIIVISVLFVLFTADVKVVIEILLEKME